MNRTLLLAALLGSFTLAACDRQPVVINTPAPPPVAVPGPAGPTGATGETGAAGTSGSTGETGSTGSTGTTGSDGKKGEAGKNGTPGDGTTVIVIPPAASAPN